MSAQSPLPRYIPNRRLRDLWPFATTKVQGYKVLIVVLSRSFWIFFGVIMGAILALIVVALG